MRSTAWYGTCRVKICPPFVAACDAAQRTTGRKKNRKSRSEDVQPYQPSKGPLGTPAEQTGENGGRGPKRNRVRLGKLIAGKQALDMGCEATRTLGPCKRVQVSTDDCWHLAAAELAELLDSRSY